MKITEVAVKRPVSAIVLMVGIIIFGITSMLGMNQELTPEMNMPILIISTIYPGAGPEDVETLVTREIEGTVATLSGIDTVYSYSMENISLVVMQYEYGTNMDIAYTDVKESLDRISNILPDLAQKPIIAEIDLNAMETMSLSIRSSTQDNLLGYVEEEIVPEFEKLSTVADVSVSGGQEEYIRVELKEELMGQYGVTMTSIIGSLSAADFSMPTGTADFGSQELNIRSSAEARTIAALQNIPLATNTGALIRLGDVSEVYHNTRAASSLSRYNGEDNINLGIQKRQSATAVSVSRQVTRIVDELNAQNPDVTVSIVDDNSESIQSSISSVGSTLLLSIALSMFVLFLFLGDFKASFIIGSSMPISLLVTFVLMDMMGFSLNIVTMSAMVLGVGMMVDNSIVVIDSCFKVHTEEHTFLQSAIEGANFVLGSIIGATITTVIVFLPLAVIPGMAGQLFRPLGFTIIFSLTASLVSAMTLVPLFFARFEPIERSTAPAARWLARTEERYANFLRKILTKKKAVMGISIGLVVLSLIAAFNLNTELIPPIDQGIISISIGSRPGLKTEHVDKMAAQLEEMVAKHPDVDRYSLTSGSSGLSLSTDGASLAAYLKDDRKMETWQVIEQWREETKDFQGADITISASSMLTGMVSDTIDVNFQGNDLDALRAFSEQVQTLMKEHPDIVTVSSSVSNPTPQAEIVVDPLKAAAVNMSPYLVASSVNQMFSGVKSVTVRQDNKNYDVWVEFPDGRYNNVTDLYDLVLTSPLGTSVPLADIATIEFTDSPQTIIKQDNQYLVTISATPRQAARFTAQSDITSMVAAMTLPSGIEPMRDTATQMMYDEFASLGEAILVAIILVFMVMAIQFESVRHSMMVMVSIPFSMIGSFGLLFLAGETISMPSLLGFLILVGTVVNNGILFVDTTNVYRLTMPLEDALVETGRTRLRPILMTTLTTVLSMLPLSLGIGEGTEIMTGLGMVVIGGLTVSTLLTLLLMPTFYLILDDDDEKRAKRQAKKDARRQRREAKDNPHGSTPKEASSTLLVDITETANQQQDEPANPPASGKEY